MHGGRSPGAPPGEQHPNFKTGRYTKEARELSALMRELARAGETMVARVMDAHGLKPPAALRRRRHVKRALAAAKAKGRETAG